MIAVRGLWKRFRQTDQKPLSLKRLLLLQGLPEFGPWVLQDLALEIPRGATVGIVGKNGCGKTTLLRLVAGILRPDRGTVEAPGRVVPLLGLGAGFHPDLTGRENIFLNASIFGFTRRQIVERYDEIVEFSGLGERIETPLRFYSSGMNVRLGFSVAAYLDPDVLLIDEVLAVGDAGFRKRCTARIAELQARGRTIVLVSHDMSEIERFCSRCVWLAEGRIAGDGEPHQVIPDYLASWSR